MKLLDIQGKKIGRLTIVKRENGKWLCHCDCGNKKLMKIYGNHAKSCGCLKSPAENEYHERIKQRLVNNRKITPSGCWEWTLNKDKAGYGMMTYRQDPIRCHRASYLAFKGPINDNLCVCHTCDNKLCFNPEHLFLGSNADNTADMISKKRQACGSRCGTSKLNEDQIIEMRTLYSTGNFTQKELGEKFGIHHHKVYEIVNKRTWRHV